MTPVPPGSLSVEVNVMVTLLLFQPAAFGCGESDAFVTGGVLSDPVTPGIVMWPCSSIANVNEDELPEVTFPPTVCVSIGRLFMSKLWVVSKKLPVPVPNTYT